MNGRIAECADCGSQWEHMGARGRLPKRCPACKERDSGQRRSAQRRSVSEAMKAYNAAKSESERRAAASHAATERWARSTAEQRSAAARHAARSGRAPARKLHGPPQPCIHCGAIVARRDAKVCRSEDCKKLQRRDNSRKLMRRRRRAGIDGKRYVLAAPCVDCGAVRRVRSDRKGESSRCRPCHNRRIAAERWADVVPTDERKRWKISDARRLAIYDRDGWRCQLCGELVDRDADPLDDWAPTLDHVEPRCYGGGHDDDNLRTAHRWCNAVRGDGRRDAELVELFAAA